MGPLVVVVVLVVIVVDTWCRHRRCRQWKREILSSGILQASVRLLRCFKFVAIALGLSEAHSGLLPDSFEILRVSHIVFLDSSTSTSVGDDFILINVHQQRFTNGHRFEILFEILRCYFFLFFCFLFFLFLLKIRSEAIGWNFAKDAARINNERRPRYLHFSSQTVLLIHLFVCIRMLRSFSFLFRAYVDLLPEEGNLQVTHKPR